MKKKKKNENLPNPPSGKEPSPLSQLAQDFAKMDEEDPLCAKKNDGTD
jgi:hypothetical protein